MKYKEAYEKTKGKVIGIKSVSDDSQMAHSALATKLQSDRHYKKEYEDTKTKYRWGLGGETHLSSRELSESCWRKSTDPGSEVETEKHKMYVLI